MAILEKLFSKITFKDYPDTSTPINANNLNKMTDAIDGIDDRVVELNSNLTPISLGQYDGSAMGGKNGGIVIESKAGSFSQSTALSVELKHAPINPYGVVVSQVTQASNSAHLMYASVSGKTLTINMSTVCGAVRFAIAYLTADDMTV